MKSAGKILIGLLAGAATGAILGILFAPDKGSVTRRKIAKKSKAVKEDVKNKFADIIEKTKEKIEHKGSEDKNEKNKAEMA